MLNGNGIIANTFNIEKSYNNIPLQSLYPSPLAYKWTRVIAPNHIDNGNYNAHALYSTGWIILKDTKRKIFFLY